MVAGAAAYAVLSTDVGLRAYGALSDALPVPALVVVLLLAGLAIGYGARWAGCTSGHGISGCSVGSPGSLATTAVFFGVAVAVAVTLALHALTGSPLGDYRTIHEGLLLRDPYIYLMMIAAVGTAAVRI